MYKCQNCNGKSQPREPKNMIVVQRREKLYQNKDSEGELVKTTGSETVKEVGVCNGCKQRYEQIHGKQN